MLGAIVNIYTRGIKDYLYKLVRVRSLSGVYLIYYLLKMQHINHTF